MKQLLARIPLLWVAYALILLPMVIKAMQVWLSLPLPYGGTLDPSDPDSWLRLTLVRDWLSGGEWYSHVVARSNTPFEPTISPWTRPLDMVIACFTFIQFSVEGLTDRLIHAALILPLLWMALFLTGLYRILRILCPMPSAPLMASVMIGLAYTIYNYFGTGNADHHAMLATVFLWSLLGIITPHPSTLQTAVSGAFLGLLLWISPEGFALIAAVYGWYGLLWLIGNSGHAKPFPLLATSVALTVTIAMMIERPAAAWGTPIYDSISIVYVAMLSATAAMVWLLYSIRPANLPARLVTGIAGCAAVMAFIYQCYPLMFHGTMVGVDPYIFKTFLARITETKPLYKQTTLYCIAILLQPLAALLFLICALRTPPAILSRHHCWQLGYLLLATLALYVMQQRFYYYFYPVVILALAPFLAALFSPREAAVEGRWPARWIAPLTPNAQMMRRLPIFIGVFVLQFVLWASIPSVSTQHSRQIDSCRKTLRQMIQGGALNDLGGGKGLNLFIGTDVGGEVLFFTPHRIIASNYHREGAGIRYVWEADQITDMRKLRPYLAERKVEALVLCPVVYYAEDSALQALRMGRTPPSWLTRVSYPLPPADVQEPREPGSDPVIFRVR